MGKNICFIPTGLCQIFCILLSLNIPQKCYWYELRVLTDQARAIAPESSFVHKTSFIVWSWLQTCKIKVSGLQTLVSNLEKAWRMRLEWIGARIPSTLYKTIFHWNIFPYIALRLGICRDRRDRRSCKSFVSCVNFSRKQRSFLHILQIFTHLNVNFLHNY